MSSVSSMLPMLLVIGLAVVAFIKRCDFLPELCNPSVSATPPPATATGAPLLTWEDYKKAAKEQKKDSDRVDETQKAARNIEKWTGRSTPTAPFPTSSPSSGTGDIDALVRSKTMPVSKYSRVAYF
jgi:hypothetical protein